MNNIESFEFGREVSKKKLSRTTKAHVEKSRNAILMPSDVFMI